MFDTLSLNTPKPYRATKNGVELFVRATPKAAKNKIGGTICDADGKTYLKIYVTTAPEDGHANTSIIALLSTFFSLPKSCILLKSGDTHRFKSFLLDGISMDEVTIAIGT